MAEYRMGLLRVTLEGLADSLGLGQGIRIRRVTMEPDLCARPNDLVLLLEDTVATRLPLVLEGEMIPVVNCDTVSVAP